LTFAHQLTSFAEQLASLDTHRVAEVCLERISTWLQARLASLYQFDEPQHSLVLIGQTHPYAIDSQVDMDRQARQPMVRAARLRRTCVLRDWAQGADLLGRDVHRAHPVRYQTQTCILAPLMIDGKLIGVFNLADPVAREGFDPRHVEVLQALTRLIGTALHNARTFQEIRHQAMTDPLTGLPNRRTFLERLNQELLRSRRYKLPLSLALIDVDALKEVNDTYGHAAGDAVLREVARRIRYMIREIDVPARFGGDEFAVILPNTPLEQAERAVRRLALTAAHRPCQWQGHAIRITLSIGVGQYENQASAQDLITAADASLYLAKSRGRNCVAAST